MTLERALKEVRLGYTIARVDDESIVIEPSDLKQETITFDREDFERDWDVVKGPLLTGIEYNSLIEMVDYACLKIKSITKRKWVGEERYYLEIVYEDEPESECTPSFNKKMFSKLELDKKYTLKDFGLWQAGFDD